MRGRRRPRSTISSTSSTASSACSASGTASQQQFEQARQAYETGRQQLASKQQDVAVALANIGGDPDIPLDQHPMVQHAQAALDRAELNLSYTVITAPENGIVTKVEQLAGRGLCYRLHPSVLADVDGPGLGWKPISRRPNSLICVRAKPRRSRSTPIPAWSFQAKVESLSPGTGLTFSLLPPENATGNWVKVVQRLPVRISIDRFDPDAPLHAGSERHRRSRYRI